MQEKVSNFTHYVADGGMSWRAASIVWMANSFSYKRFSGSLTMPIAKAYRTIPESVFLQACCGGETDPRVSSKMERTMNSPPSVRKTMLVKRSCWRCSCPLAWTWFLTIPTLKVLLPCAASWGALGTSRSSFRCSLRGPVTCLWLTGWWRQMCSSGSEKATQLARSSTDARRRSSTVALCHLCLFPEHLPTWCHLMPLPHHSCSMEATGQQEVW